MLRNQIKRFQDDEEGAVIAFVIVLFLIMFIASGMAIDFMRHETARADLQNALDRGVLAAADLTQTAQLQDGVDEEIIVADYMKSRSFRPDQMNLTVRTPINGARARRIEAEASYELNTYFLKLLGMPTMRVPAMASAEQRQVNTEITLVLDVSYSMNTLNADGTDTRIGSLITAAQDFVDVILTDESRDRTLVSIVTYNHNSSLNADVADRLNMEMHHTFSHCVNWAADDLTTTGPSSVAPRVAGGVFGVAPGVALQVVDPTDGSLGPVLGHYFAEDLNGDGLAPNATGRLQQAQHFTMYYSAAYPTTGSCNEAGVNDAVVFSNNNDQLKTMIGALTAHGETAIYRGVRTAAMFLDPGTRTVSDDMINDGELDGSFSGWPLDWRAPDSRKIMVIMTDGRNTRSVQLPPTMYNTRLPNTWRANPPSSSNWQSIRDLTTGAGVSISDDQAMHEICDTLKVAGTQIYTIGFELGTATSPPAQALAPCGSSPANNFLVYGDAIRDAFEQIASDITNLKLVN